MSRLDPFLTEELKERARGLGFDRIGIAAAARLDRDGAALADWLRHDRHATMAWMAREPERRADPTTLLSGCRSVVALGMNYWPGQNAAEIPEGRARVALYARGRDYHKVLGQKLKDLAAWLESRAGTACRTFVDTGPVLERAWAERAGLGWIGKNANLLTRDLGSWLLLGELLTTAALVPDPGPHWDHCGSCTACLEACPTSAIVAPGVVDSNSCVSYWTIEHRGPIPKERRAGIGEWIFGCDDCQTVCPWNQSLAPQAAEDPFPFRRDLAGVDARDILALDRQRFLARFRGTALMRAKWEGMRRNACIVLGNQRRPDAVPVLESTLRDSDPTLRGHAAWALGRVGGDDARSALGRALEVETDGSVRDEILTALAACACPPCE